MQTRRKWLKSTALFSLGLGAAAWLFAAEKDRTIAEIYQRLAEGKKDVYFDASRDGNKYVGRFVKFTDNFLKLEVMDVGKYGSAFDSWDVEGRRNALNSADLVERFGKYDFRAFGDENDSYMNETTGESRRGSALKPDDIKRFSDLARKYLDACRK